MKRNIFLDIVRVIAVLAVVMIHTTAMYMSYPLGSIEFSIGNILGSISRLGVPLFLMISGSLMLDESRDITIQKLYFNYLKNILVVLLSWSAIYSVLYNVILVWLDGGIIDYNSVISSFVMGHYHMWYLYMLLGIYLLTPFLRTFVNKENKKLVTIFLIISLLTQFTTPIFNELSILNNNFKIIVTFLDKCYLDFFGIYISYYIVGWYIFNLDSLKKNIKKLIYLVGLFSLFLTIIYVNYTGDYNNAYTERNILIFLYSTSAFVWFKFNVNRVELNDTSKKLLEKISKLTFGVYIIHPILQTFLDIFFSYTSNKFLYLILYYILLTLMSFVSCFVISKIPIIKKIIRT